MYVRTESEDMEPDSLIMEEYISNRFELSRCSLYIFRHLRMKQEFKPSRNTCAPSKMKIILPL